MLRRWSTFAPQCGLRQGASTKLSAISVPCSSRPSTVTPPAAPPKCSRRPSPRRWGGTRFRAMLNCYIEASLGDEGRRGCLVVASAAELSTYDPDMAGLVGVALQRVETRLRDLVRFGQADGSISPSVDAGSSRPRPVVFPARLEGCWQGGAEPGRNGFGRRPSYAVAGMSVPLPAALPMAGVAAPYTHGWPCCSPGPAARLPPTSISPVAAGP